jgi:hypothetical protein
VLRLSLTRSLTKLQRFKTPKVIGERLNSVIFKIDPIYKCRSVMRIRISVSFDGEIISPKIARLSDTIDNVKAKIDNVKVKIQDKKEGRPWSRPTLARRAVSGQLAASPTSSPLEGPPRQVSTSHDESPPRTTSTASAGAWAQTHNAIASTDTRGGTVPHAMQIQQPAAM